MNIRIFIYIIVTTIIYSGISFTSHAQQLDLTSSPNWSPDGNSLVVSSFSENASFDIWTINLSTNEVINLTDDLINDEIDPIFSPNGNYIAYIESTFGNSADFEVWLALSEGSQKINISQDTNNLDYQLSWSPSGRYLAYISCNELCLLGGEIVIYDIHLASEIERLSDLNFALSSVVWSQDSNKIFMKASSLSPNRLEGEYVTIEEIENSQHEIWEYSLEDDNISSIMNLELPLSYLAVSEYNNTIIGSYRNQVWEVDISKAQVTLIYEISTLDSNEDIDITPVPSPVDANIVLNYTNFTRDKTQLILLNQNTGEEQLLRETPRLAHFVPSWSPDGTMIAYAEGLLSGLDIFTIDIDNLEIRNITESIP